jgi:hypothetical protein
MASTRMGNRMAVAVACVSLFSCHEASAPWNTEGLLTIITDRTDYQRNQQLLVRIKNGTDRIIYDDRCGGEVQGFEYIGKWNASYGASRSCGSTGNPPLPLPDWRASSIAIQPGDTYIDTFPINGAAYPGTWRVELALRDKNGELLRLDQRISNLFLVHLPPE